MRKKFHPEKSEKETRTIRSGRGETPSVAAAYAYSNTLLYY